MSKLDSTLKSIKSLDKSYLERAQERLDRLTKPQGSLGRLEEFARRIVAITEDIKPSVSRKRIYVFAADHGVAAKGVSAYPQEVTKQMVYNFIRGGAGINVLARHVGAEVRVVDIGVKGEFVNLEGLISRKIGYGTADISDGPAMSRDDAIAAVEVGIELAEVSKSDGVQILGTGDMGIGNTTPSSAIVAALTGANAEDVTGRGTGIDDETLSHKIEIIKRSLEVNRDSLGDPLSVLSALGGYEIAGICGLVIGAAKERIPVVVDGFISSAGALVALSLDKKIKEYVFFSHKSAERGHREIFTNLGTKPILDLEMRLGEGTGTALAMSLIEAGVKIYNEMATFDEAAVAGRIK
ncbi:MAG: nicotinate-nucleotide--dimethylbenzimidazole phosphoribosyltransferase [bacterium]